MHRQQHSDDLIVDKTCVKIYFAKGSLLT